MLKCDPEATLDSDVVVMELTASFAGAALVKCNASSLGTSSHLTSLHVSHCEETEGPHVNELSRDLFMCRYQKAYTPVAHESPFQ